jgi:hypothetical protein
MASAVVEIPFIQDATIYKEMDWQYLLVTFYNDEAQTDPVDFSTSTFTGEVLDKPGGASVATLSFNTPANDGVIQPKLTDTQTAALTGTTNHYYVYVVDAAGIKTPYFSGRLTISDNFKAGS